VRELVKDESVITFYAATRHLVHHLVGRVRKDKRMNARAKFDGARHSECPSVFPGMKERMAHPGQEDGRDAVSHGDVE
jgi:hypothetical protein